jgi:uncharacterized protein
MRILIDTNSLVSAIIFTNGVTAKAVNHIKVNHRLCLNQYAIDETLDVIGRKWSERMPELWAFLGASDYDLLPEGDSKVEIRDAKDHPILDAAIVADVDIILTGDGGFHALDIKRPRILNAREYLDELGGFVRRWF